MKKKLLILIPMLLLTGCEFGGYAKRCDDNVADKPKDEFTYSVKNPKINNSYKYELENPYYGHERDTKEERDQYFEESEKQIIPDFSLMSESLKHENENVLTYAQNTSLKDTAKLPSSTRYMKIFDGQVSCVGDTANSRIGIYSDGIILELGRTLQSAEGITIYMTHNILTLRMKAIFTLYKPTGNLGDGYDEFVFSFYTNLGTSVAGPKFFYLDLTKILADVSILKGCNMLGLRYERIDLTEEEKEDKEIRSSYAQYYDNLYDEKNHTKSETTETFVKLYDIGLPYSTWR